MYNTNTPQVEYVYESGKNIYSFNFKIFNDTDLYVYIQEDVETSPRLITYYDTYINGDAGGTITLRDGYKSGSTLILLRELEIDREIQYEPNGDMFAGTVNDDQDYQTYLIGDIHNTIDRALLLPIGSEASNEFPVGSDKYIKWNEDGTELVAEDTLPQWIIDEINKYIQDVAIGTGIPTNTEYHIANGSGSLYTSLDYNTIQVYDMGVLLNPNTDYIYTGKLLTFSPPLLAGSEVTVVGWQVVEFEDIVGVKNFKELEDTPNTYIGQAGKTVVVSDDETGLTYSDGYNLDNYVEKTGDEMSGPLTISHDTTQAALRIHQHDQNADAIGLYADEGEYCSIGWYKPNGFGQVRKTWGMTSLGSDQFLLNREDENGNEFGCIHIGTNNKVNLVNGGTISNYTPQLDNDIATVGYVNQIAGGGTPGDPVDLSAYVKKIGYQGPGDEMSGPLVIANQSADETGLLIKQFADNKDAIGIHSENTSEWCSIGFYDEVGGGVFNKTWGIGTLSNNQMVIGKYDDNGSNYQEAIHISTNSVVTAKGLLSTNGNKTMDANYVPTKTQSVTTKKYVDSNNQRSEKVLVWSGTPTNGGVTIASCGINPDTGNYTGEYLVVYASTTTNITTASGAPNVSDIYVFNASQHATGNSSGWIGTDGKMHQSSCLLKSGYFRAFNFDGAAMTNWYIHRIYRVQKVQGSTRTQSSYGSGDTL